jgi:hypothetical protein
MRFQSLLCLVFVFGGSVFSASAGPPVDENYLAAINLPAEKQNWKQKDAVQKLAQSLVPTREAADTLALGAFEKQPGLDDRELEYVAGLYFLGRDIAGFGKTGDLFWEVRVRRGDGMSGVIWISTTTKTALILFPNSPPVPPAPSQVDAISKRTANEVLAKIRKDMPVTELFGYINCVPVTTDGSARFMLADGDLWLTEEENEKGLYVVKDWKFGKRSP